MPVLHGVSLGQGYTTWRETQGVRLRRSLHEDKGLPLGDRTRLQAQKSAEYTGVTVKAIGRAATHPSSRRSAGSAGSPRAERQAVVRLPHGCLHARRLRRIPLGRGFVEIDVYSAELGGTRATSLWLTADRTVFVGRRLCPAVNASGPKPGSGSGSTWRGPQGQGLQSPRRSLTWALLALCGAVLTSNWG